MDIDFLAKATSSVIYFGIDNNSVLFLQAAGLIGLLSILLTCRGNFSVMARFGIVAGVVNFILVAVLEEWLQGPLRFYLRNDLLFIAGFFGGWSNASAALFLTALSRLIFDAPAYQWGNLFDITAVSYGSVLLSYIFKKNKIETVTNASISLIILCRSLVVTFPLIILSVINAVPQSQSLSLGIARLMSNFTISAIVLYVVVFILKREISRERQLHTDLVSLLPNRRALLRDIEQSFTYFQRQKALPPQILMLVEIDNLSELIQEYDHNYTDNLVRKLGSELKQISNSPLLADYQPTVYSFSDRSFALILHNITVNTIQEKGIAHTLHGRLLLMEQTPSNDLTIWPTIGVIGIRFSETFSPSWFLRALNAMEKYSHTPVHYFKSTLTRQLQLENWLRIQIKKWIREGTVPLWLQPKMSLSHLYCTGAEALLRARENDTQTRHIPPPLIVSIATKYQLLADLEWAIITTVVRHLHKLPAPCRHLKLSVNITPASLTNSGFAKKICRLLSQYGVAGEHLVIEVTETSQLQVSEIVQENVTILNRAGVSLSLDDFGSGYSSLSLLAKLPFDELKLDYAMISGLDNPRTRSAIMLSADGARHYAARIVAEGIETERQKNQLLRMGITQGQGFLFAKAIPFDEFVDFACCYPPPSIRPFNSPLFPKPQPPRPQNETNKNLPAFSAGLNSSADPL